MTTYHFKAVAAHGKMRTGTLARELSCQRLTTSSVGGIETDESFRGRCRGSLGEFEMKDIRAAKRNSIRSLRQDGWLKADDVTPVINAVAANGKTRTCTSAGRSQRTAAGELSLERLTTSSVVGFEADESLRGRCRGHMGHMKENRVTKLTRAAKCSGMRSLREDWSKVSDDPTTADDAIPVIQAVAADGKMRTGTLVGESQRTTARKLSWRRLTTSTAVGLETDERCRGQLGLDMNEERLTKLSVRSLSEHVWVKAADDSATSDEAIRVTKSFKREL